MTILEQIAEHAKKRVNEAKSTVRTEEIKRMAHDMPAGCFEFENALKKPGMSFICECKKASPSKGIISPYFPYPEIAKQYESAGADCISVLTEPKWFMGSDEHLRQISQSVSIPCLRKDFTVDEYMIYQAKLLGASAVLLICAILTRRQLEKFIGICDSLGISALTEAHSKEEIETALSAGARIIGVNNRNLNDFSVDSSNSLRLRELVPPDVIFVSESGISSADDVRKLSEAGTDAVLIGEALMTAENKKKMLKILKGGAL